MMRSLEYKSAGHSHVGMVRKLNEDAYLDAPDAGLWVVADGMGGHSAGEVVSRHIVESLARIPSQCNFAAYVNAVRVGIQQSNEMARQEAANRGVGTMGSTVVVLVARDDHAVALWAGDSRLYRLRGGRLEQISHDHSYVQELVDGGVISDVEARHHPMGNVVTRAVGAGDSLELESREFLVQPGDTFLLCSDGLNKTAEDAEIRGVLVHAEPYEVARSLVHLGLMRGAPDNITAVVIKASAALSG